MEHYLDLSTIRPQSKLACLSFVPGVYTTTVTETRRSVVLDYRLYCRSLYSDHLRPSATTNSRVVG